MNRALETVAAVLSSVALLISGSASASADESDPALVEPTTEIPRVEPTPTQAGEGASVLGIPSDCFGDTYNPHYSPKTQMASVHGRTWCEYAVPALSVQTKLYRDDWWGWNLMATDYSSRTSNRTSYDATPHADCGNAPERLYRGYSTHTVKLASATASGATSNNNSFKCG